MYRYCLYLRLSYSISVWLVDRSSAARKLEAGVNPPHETRDGKFGRKVQDKQRPKRRELSWTSVRTVRGTSVQGCSVLCEHSVTLVRRDGARAS